MILQRSHIFLTEALTFIALLPSFCDCSAVPTRALREPLENASPTRVGGAEFDRHPVTRENADRLETGLACRVAEHLVTIVQLDPVERVGKGFDDPPDQWLSHA